ncbi:MAG: 3-hydroxyacyl-CoA dehydrogenase family protein [Pseudomonadota bacterium]
MPPEIPPSPIRTTAILGAGVMGAQIALSLALGGRQVRLWGRRPEALPDAIDRIEAALDFMIEAGLAASQEREVILARVSTTAEQADAVAGADLVLESVAEDLAIKQAVLRSAEQLAAPSALLSSTTSALSPTTIQGALTRPHRFVVAHYAQPAHLVKLVEVVPGEVTAPEATDTITALLRDTGKTPALCPDIPGFLWARIQHAVLREFASLVGKGLVTPETCDAILKDGYAARLPAMGAFEHADLAGLDLMNGAAAKAVWADLSNVSDPGETPVGELFTQGHTGMRSGRGFYDWTRRDPEAFKRQRDAEIVRRVLIQAGGEVQPPKP